MSDTSGAPAPAPAAPPIPQPPLPPAPASGRDIRQSLRDGVRDVFGPVMSIFSIRTLWLLGLLVALGFAFGWRDVKMFGLSAVWCVIGVAIAYHARKFLAPKWNADDLYKEAIAGNTAAAIASIRIGLIEFACILVVALTVTLYGR